MLDYRLRPYADRDAAEVDDLAVAAFEQFRSEYSDWPAMQAGLRRMSTLAEIGEIIVAEGSDRVIGAVAYIPPRGRKARFFDASWPIIRMLIVDPGARGGGIGRALTEECIDRARRDGSHVIALHTSPIMNVALPMYLRTGFHPVRDAPPLYGVSYAVYLKQLTNVGEAIMSDCLPAGRRPVRPR
jgi:GNAT superfamily N-acetyltransferase